MHVTKIRVRLSETDALGIVYYAQYFVYFDVARLEMLRKLGITREYLQSQGFSFFAAEARCRYLASARFDDVLRAKTWVASLGRTSLKYGHVIEREHDAMIIAEGHVVDVLVDRSGRPTALPEELRAKLQTYLTLPRRITSKR